MPSIISRFIEQQQQQQKESPFPNVAHLIVSRSCGLSPGALRSMYRCTYFEEKSVGPVRWCLQLLEWVYFAHFLGKPTAAATTATRFNSCHLPKCFRWLLVGWLADCCPLAVSNYHINRCRIYGWCCNEIQQIFFLAMTTFHFCVLEHCGVRWYFLFAFDWIHGLHIGLVIETNESFTVDYEHYPERLHDDTEFTKVTKLVNTLTTVTLHRFDPLMIRFTT